MLGSGVGASMLAIAKIDGNEKKKKKLKTTTTEENEYEKEEEEKRMLLCRCDEEVMAYTKGVVQTRAQYEKLFYSQQKVHLIFKWKT